jgi:hypothetical protein
MADKFLEAQCRELLNTHEHTLKHVIEEVCKEIHKREITGEDAFSYAKQTIRNQGIEEGLILLMQKINKHANKQ